ncbi:DUF3096 domain-containing protein [Pseudothauera lacus]|uniref:DUF3096 domain-containing protein n=1 Tax=Pseudothauera lacus TaxID=2136175 RepID=UPI002E272118
MGLAPLVSLIAGILIPVMPRLLNYIVAFLPDHHRLDRPLRRRDFQPALNHRSG